MSDLKRHEFTEGDGERCWKCGEKDWMAEPVCSESKIDKDFWKRNE